MSVRCPCNIPPDSFASPCLLLLLPRHLSRRLYLVVACALALDEHHAPMPLLAFLAALAAFLAKAVVVIPAGNACARAAHEQAHDTETPNHPVCQAVTRLARPAILTDTHTLRVALAVAAADVGDGGAARAHTAAIFEAEGIIAQAASGCCADSVAVTGVGEAAITLALACRQPPAVFTLARTVVPAYAVPSANVPGPAPAFGLTGSAAPTRINTRREPKLTVALGVQQALAMPAA